MRTLFEFLFGVGATLDDLDEQERRRIRVAQIGAVVQLVPLTMTINILNATIIVDVFWGTGSNVFLSIWGTLVALQAGAALWSWKLKRHNRPTGASARSIRRTIGHAALLALTWGAAPLVLFPHADTVHQLVMAAMIAGMISGGAFCLSTVPNAGLAYTWTLAVISAGALWLADYSLYAVMAVLVVIYAAFISRNVAAHGSLFINHLRAELKLEAQREVIGLLLNDFQEHASDWLWETDATGVLTRVSDRFAEAVEKAPSEMHGARFADLIGGKDQNRPPELLVSD